MVEKPSNTEKTNAPAHAHRYPVTLEYHNGQVFYAKDALEKPILESADRIIMTARRKQAARSTCLQPIS